MRKYLYLAGAAAVAFATALTVVPASAAPAASVHVLTIGKAGGKAVAVGAILKSNLKAGTTANFFKSATSTQGVKCAKSSFTAKVTANPVKPGVAKESLTSESFGNCTSNVPLVRGVKSVKLTNLPYVTRVSDARGFPLVVSGRSASAPLKTTIVLNTGLGAVSCTYSAAKISGHSSNVGSTNIFVKQKFTKSAGPGLCFPFGFFTVTYGPIKDTSVTGSPRVFVN